MKSGAFSAIINCKLYIVNWLAALVFFGTILLPVSALAAPLTDFQLGKFAIEADYWHGSSFVEAKDYVEISGNGFNTLLTVALDKDFAVRYGYNWMADQNGGTNYQALNVIYKINFIYELIDRYIRADANGVVADQSQQQSQQQYTQQQAVDIIQRLQRDNLFGAVAGVTRLSSSIVDNEQYAFTIGYVTSLRFLHTMSVFSELSIGTNMQVFSDSGFAWQPENWLDVNVGYRSISSVFNNSQYISESGFYCGMSLKN